MISNTMTPPIATKNFFISPTPRGYAEAAPRQPIARRGDVLALRWENVDYDAATIRVVESLEQTRGGLRFKPPKNGRGGAVALPAFAVEELPRLKREQAERHPMLGVCPLGVTLVCARADGEPLQPQSLTHEFPRFLARVGRDFPRVRGHDLLRHSRASQLLAAGVHPKVAQERPGRTRVKTALDL
jgi:integrase